MEFAEECFSLFVNKFESMTTKTIHVAKPFRCSSVTKQDHNLMGGFRSQTDEVPKCVRVLKQEFYSRNYGFIENCFLKKNFSLFKENDVLKIGIKISTIITKCVEFYGKGSEKRCIYGKSRLLKSVTLLKGRQKSFLNFANNQQIV